MSKAFKSIGRKIERAAKDVGRGVEKFVNETIVEPHENAADALLKKPGEEAQRLLTDGVESVSKMLTPDITIDLPEEAPAPPSMDLEGSLAAQDAMQRNRRRQGRASTILTSPQGTSGQAPVGTRTLLGG